MIYIYIYTHIYIYKYIHTQYIIRNKNILLQILINNNIT